MTALVHRHQYNSQQPIEHQPRRLGRRPKKPCVCSGASCYQNLT
jgi:hypothetical protein